MTTHLLLYEIVLLILGVLLFVILCAALVWSILKGESLKRLLLFFPIAIAMIAYPSIQEIRVEKGFVSITTQQDELEKDPHNEEAREDLKQQVLDLESRATSAEDYYKLSNAYILLDDPESAIRFAQQGIEKTEDKGDEEILKSTPYGQQEESLNFQRLIDVAKVQQTLEKSSAQTNDSVTTVTNHQMLRDLEDVDPDKAKYLKDRYLLNRK